MKVRCSMLTVIFASLSCPLLQPPPSGPFTSSFGGAGFSDDPFKSKQDTPALPPKKPAPPRPKPPSGQYTFFSHRRLPTHPPTVTGQCGAEGPFVHQPRIELCSEVCTGNKRVSPLPSCLCPLMVCAWSTPPALSCGLESVPGPDGLPKVQGLGHSSVQGEVPHSPWLTCGQGFAVPLASPPHQAFLRLAQGGPGVGTAAESAPSIQYLHAG